MIKPFSFPTIPFIPASPPKDKIWPPSKTRQKFPRFVHSISLPCPPQSSKKAEEAEEPSVVEESVNAEEDIDAA
jgi:hypothetical protein